MIRHHFKSCLLPFVLATACSAGEPQLQKVTDSTITGTVSFRAYLQSFTDYTTGNLLVRDLRTAKHRVLVEAQEGEGADWSAISKDGTFVAYTWFAKDGATELRVVASDGLRGRTLIRDPEVVEYLEPHDWTPDGKEILVRLFYRDWSAEIALVDANTGSVRRLRRLDFVPWGRPAPRSNPGPCDSVLLLEVAARWLVFLQPEDP